MSSKFQVPEARTTYYRYGGRGLWAQVPDAGFDNDIVIRNLRTGVIKTVDPTCDEQLGDDVTQFSKADHKLVLANEAQHTKTLTLTIDDINTILAVLHLNARVNGDTALYSRFVAAVGKKVVTK